MRGYECGMGIGGGAGGGPVDGSDELGGGPKFGAGD